MPAKRVPVPAASVPNAPAAGDTAVPAASDAAIGAEPAVPAGERVRVRVISASHGHKVDTVETIDADQLDAAVAAGWADPRPAAVAEAERLLALHEVHRDIDKRLQLQCETTSTRTALHMQPPGGRMIE